MKRSLIIIASLITTQLYAQVIPEKIISHAAIVIKKISLGKLLTPLSSTKPTTSKGSEVQLNSGDKDLPGRLTSNGKASTYDDNDLSCTETISRLENTVTQFTLLDGSLQSNIYPGQLIDGLELIKSGTYKTFVLPKQFKRMPYKVSFNEFVRTDGKVLPESPRVADNDGDGSFDRTDYLSARGNYMTKLGSTLPSVTSFIEFIEINSVQQLETELGITVSAGISPEAMTLLTGIPAGIDVNVDVITASKSQVKKSRLLARIVHEYYDATVEPTNDNYKTLIEPIADNQIPQTLAYVKSVIYGAIGFVMFESTGTFSELKSAVSTALGVEIGIGELDFGHVDVEVDRESKEDYEKESISVKAYGIGLNGSKPRDLTSISEIKKWMLNFTPFSNGSYGQPIKFILQYINSDDLCSVTYRANIASKDCSPKPVTSYKYDVKLKLAKIQGVKIDEGGKPGDNEEDLYGEVYLKRSKVGSTVYAPKNVTQKIGYTTFKFKEYPHLFFDRGKINPMHIPKGIKKVDDNEVTIGLNKSYNEIKNMEFSIGYNLKDEEINTPRYECADCNTDDLRIPTPLGQNQLFALNNAHQINGWVPLKYGNDYFFEMNFYEKGTNRKRSHIRFWFQVLVKAK